jgi:hypothetical protein
MPNDAEPWGFPDRRPAPGSDLTLSGEPWGYPRRQRLAPEGDEPGLDRPVITRTYRGNSDEIEALRRADADELALQGYYPKAQALVPGSWDVGLWVVAVLLLAVFGLGLFVLIYLIAVKPAGTLSVIYEQVARVERDSGEAQGPAARLRELSALRDEGAVTADEYTAKRAEIIRDL